MDEQKEQGRWRWRGYNLFEISSSFVGSTELLFHSCLSPLLVFAFLPFLSLPLFFHFIYLLLSSLFITLALNSLLSVLFLVLCLSSLPMSALVCFFDLASRLFWSKSHITSKHSVIFLLIQLRNTCCSWFQTKFHQKYSICSVQGSFLPRLHLSGKADRLQRKSLMASIFTIIHEKGRVFINIQGWYKM